jgi:hypothetical protein
MFILNVHPVSLHELSSATPRRAGRRLSHESAGTAGAGPLLEARAEIRAIISPRVSRNRVKREPEAATAYCPTYANFGIKTECAERKEGHKPSPAQGMLHSVWGRAKPDPGVVRAAVPASSFPQKHSLAQERPASL